MTWDAHGLDHTATAATSASILVWGRCGREGTHAGDAVGDVLHGDGAVVTWVGGVEVTVLWRGHPVDIELLCDLGELLQNKVAVGGASFQCTSEDLVDVRHMGTLDTGERVDDGRSEVVTEHLCDCLQLGNVESCRGEDD